MVDFLKTMDVPFYVVSKDKEEIRRLRKELKGCENLLKNQDEKYRKMESLLVKCQTSNEKIKEELLKGRSCIESELKDFITSKTEEIKDVVTKEAREDYMS